METVIVPIAEELVKAAEYSNHLRDLIRLRSLTADEWIERHGSGTLRKNKKIGFRWTAQYRTERVAWEFGWEFEMLATTYVNFNDAITFGDCKACTEAGWHIERMIERRFYPNDIFEVKHVIVDGSAGKNKSNKRREGIGVVLKQTSAGWLPKGHIIFAFIATYDRDSGIWSAPRNPF